ncbi:T9SS type B sorting domain-containing protein [Flavobacterium macacae]|uniref:BIG2 domain-containing protein n=1 Tax=Flavobacterium macacae TaxID=2488993 RepID=A0A3P3WFP7_9FLAO|nr:T9SS type B sorting domain-containing protein [Flavobacterium macacae]RRJ91373.1 hypothetical protein EG849_08240 [Flavobacterium macacae]
MTFTSTLRKAILLIIFSVFFSQNSFSQCFQIESILVDACDANTDTEGQNEMVRFKVGNAPINTNSMSVSWATQNLNWGGVIQNATTASKVASLNASIIAAGGCGQVLQPTGGILPANATVILVTSYNFNTTFNSFGALTETIYIIFQNSNSIGGHFGNYGNSGNNSRTLSISFGSCSDTVTYNRSLLTDQNGQNVAADGATVVFTPNGTASYINNGCVAPVQLFTVDASPSTISTCAGNPVNLTGTAQGQQSVVWSAPSGTFSNPTSLTTTFTPTLASAGTVVPVTLTATNSCGATITDIINVTVNNATTPSFNVTPVTICTGGSVPTLNTTSPNGISGTWAPAVISNTASGNYTFTPNVGQCATPVTLSVTITNSITPDFDVTPVTFCTGSAVPTLNATSPNGISGTWAPAVVSNTASGTYTFTPNTGQCATSVTLSVTIINAVTPDFNVTPLTVCTGGVVPTLNTTSSNGITGTWAPAVISNTASGTYTFTPNAGQCATSVTLSVTITNSITPDFNVIPLTVCMGGSVPTLNTTSPNGISGTWAPAVVSNSASGNYTFTPNAGQCATPVTLSVTITNVVTPNFNITPVTVCNGGSVPTLNTTSPNGISGTWAPAVVSNTASGNYTFTPNAGQCATPVTLSVTITNNITPNFNVTPLTVCAGGVVPTLNTTSPNGISGTWAPAVVSNSASGTYTFTPNAGQCATPVTLSVTITNATTPNFNVTPLTVCNGGSVPTLNTTSPNGIAGTWAPAVVSNTASGNYTFTPTAGQCATSVTLSVTITNAATPNFNVTPLTVCTGGVVPTLNTTSPNGITGTWTPAVVSNTTSGTYTFTPNAGQCATPVTLSVTITNAFTPDFNVTPVTVCTGGVVPTLNATSPNGISGTWAPAVVSNTASGNYTFTPNAGQCATPVTLSVTITNAVTPDFNVTPLTVCTGGVVPTLNTTSPNGITGTWAPAVVSNTTSGTYTFTPTAGQCATSVTLSVTITNAVTPDFNVTPLTICTGGSVPTLNTTSPNGIFGTWSSAVVSNTTSGTYIFTPTAGQCASSVTLSVTITNAVTPDFATTLSFCNGETVPTLNTNSPNGVSGTWSPASISNTTSGNYIFTPNVGQCASSVTLAVTINTVSIATIEGPNSVCVNSSIELTNTTPNGAWTSSNTAVATIDTNGNVTGISPGNAIIKYSLNNSACGSVTKTIRVNALPNPVLNDAFLCVDNQTGLVISAVNLHSGLSNTNFSFVWTLNNTVLSTTTNAHQATEPGVYNVTATNVLTGCEASATATVGTSSMGIAEATVGRDFDRNQTITVTVTGGSGNYTYQLDNGIPQTSNVFTNIREGEYEITVRDAGGCGEMTLTVYALNYPYYFTPNGDGYHDTWNIKGLSDQPNAVIYIFDRYGKLLKQLKPSPSNGWDGTYNGHALPSTDYWFKLLYQSRDGSQKEFKAHFAMKR